MPPAPPARHRKRVIVTAPEKEIVVDGDRVFVWNDEDAPEAFADMDGMERMELDGPQTFLRHHGGMGGGFIGVRPIEMTPELRQHFGAPKDAGILVGSVEPDGPAAKAGVQVGDIVTRVDGDRIDSVRGLVRTVRHKKDGDKVTVEVLRDRAAKSLTVVVVERKDQEIRVGALEEENARNALEVAGAARFHRAAALRHVRPRGAPRRDGEAAAGARGPQARPVDRREGDRTPPIFSRGCP